MINLQKILVATDFSDHSKIALQYGLEFSKAFDAEVILFHAVDRPDILSQVPPGGEGYFPPNLNEIQEQQAQEQCETLIGDSGLTSGRIVITHGSPFVEIIKTAKEEDADLIIVGTHGRGAITHMLLGSVAERVVRKSPCPVLTVRQGEHDFAMP